MMGAALFAAAAVKEFLKKRLISNIGNDLPQHPQAD